MHIATEPANQPEVLALIEQLDAYQKPLYPAESHHGIDMAALSQPNVVFAVARDEWGQAVACGAIVLVPADGELKRMFTLPSHRGKGIARSVVQWLEAQAQAQFADCSVGVQAKAQSLSITALTPHKYFHVARPPAAWLQWGLFCAAAVHKPAEFLGRSV